jgi:hypothetical protein
MTNTDQSLRNWTGGHVRSTRSSCTRDLARATGQPYPGTLEARLAAMTGMYPPDDLDARKGIVEPPVPVPDDARWLTEWWHTSRAGDNRGQEPGVRRRRGFVGTGFGVPATAQPVGANIDALRSWNALALSAVRVNLATDADAARLYTMVDVTMYDGSTASRAPVPAHPERRHSWPAGACVTATNKPLPWPRRTPFTADVRDHLPDARRPHRDRSNPARITTTARLDGGPFRRTSLKIRDRLHGHGDEREPYVATVSAWRWDTFHSRSSRRYT